MINIFLYYILYASVVLFYGIGINRTTVISRSITSTLALNIIKSLFSIISSTVLTWLIIEDLLVPLNLTELYPFIALLIFISLTVFIEILIRITTGINTSEFAISYLIILLSLNESSTLIDAIIIPLCCITSFVLILPVLYAVRMRIDSTRLRNDKTKKKSLIMISLAIIILTTAICNITWLNPGVLP
jgi:Na+-translocating ferredoxin:NAD+ oxidoreductase RnfA subunit